MDQNAKQQVAEKLRNSGSVLVTVSKNPSVDQLASAIGLSLMLSALNKHAITVFSGQIPNTMEFLQPDKIIDSSVDGLRDFIISISKDKADKLRYKVEDDIVKIFITPYQGKIDENDLDFSQGDFNVDSVVALGVTNRDDLDAAITAQGRILHDATIMTVTAGAQGEGKMGSVNWNDPTASSISEMLVSISEALQGNVLDGPMATAFLTGIVSATDRFSNDKTSPKVMTMSAQLMAAGADQQLIATNLQLKPEIPKDSEAPAELHISDEGKIQLDGTKEMPLDTSSTPADSAAPDQPETDSQEEPATDDKNPVEAIREDVKADDKLSLDQIESQLHAHQDELKSHGLKIDEQPKTPAPTQPPPAPTPDPVPPPAQGEDPAIQALENQIDNDPQENLKNLEETLHPDGSSPPSIQPTNSGVRMPLQSDVPPADPQQPTSRVTKPVFGSDDAVDEPAIGVPQSDIPAMTHGGSSISQVKGQGPKAALDGETPALGGTFNATSDEAQRAKIEELREGRNRAILSHAPGQADPNAPTIPEVPQPQSNDMINQARQAVEAAMTSAPQAPAPIQSLNAQPMPGDGDAGGQIHIDDSGNFNPAPLMPSAPAPNPIVSPPPTAPPMPPNTQLGPPPPAQAPPMQAMPPQAPPAPPVPPPLPQNLGNNVGQMFIPPPPTGPPQNAPPQQNPFNQNLPPQ